MDDFDSYDRKMQRKLEQMPVCKLCNEHIQDELYYIIPKFGNVCQECLTDCECWND